MKIAVAGLGLIGASLAKAYKRSGATVYGYDVNNSVQEFAKLSGTLDGCLDENTVKECDLLLIAITPIGSMEYLKQIAPFITKDTIVMDCCGTKKEICKLGFELGEKYNFTFVGGHPMAGTQYSGFANSSVNLFDNATMIIVPPKISDIELLVKIKELITHAGFTHVSITTAEEHDEIIAYTSQLCHVVSNAFVKSPTAQKHKGYSAGSYNDLTRVAWLNETMWTELFVENKEPLLKEIDTLLNNLKEYKLALEENDNEKLKNLLKEGRIAKEHIDLP